MTALATAQARILVADSRITAAAQRFLAFASKRLRIDEGRMERYQALNDPSCAKPSAPETEATTKLNPCASSFVPL